MSVNYKKIKNVVEICNCNENQAKNALKKFKDNVSEAIEHILNKNENSISKFNYVNVTNDINNGSKSQPININDSLNDQNLNTYSKKRKINQLSNSNCTSLSDTTYLFSNYTKNGCGKVEKSNSIEDENVNKAIKLSLENNTIELINDDDDDELNKAIELSKKQKELEDFNKVILIEHNSNENFNKEDFKIRDKSIKLIGLKNIGNTCYLNSLLQSYFSIEPFLTFLFKIKINLIQKPFINELQLLFNEMLTSNYCYLNPIKIFNLLKLKNPNYFKINTEQQDFNELNDIILKLIEIELKDDLNLKNEFINLFYGKTIQKVEIIDQKNEIIKNEINCSTIILNLDLTLSINTIHDSLSNYTNFEFVNDYKNNNNEKVKVKKSIWFKELSTILIFQIQRIQFNKLNKSINKLNKPFKIEKLINLERYLEINKFKSIKLRNEIKLLKLKLNKLNESLNELINYKNSNLSIIEILNLNLTILNETIIDQKNNNNNNNIKLNTINLISKYSIKIKNLKLRINELNFKIKNYFKENNLSNDKFNYKLISFLIHEGKSVDFGHYYNYQFYNNKQWYKLNDKNVIKINNEFELLNLKNNLENVYSLIYIKC